MEEKKSKTKTRRAHRAGFRWTSASLAPRHSMNRARHFRSGTLHSGFYKFRASGAIRSAGFCFSFFLCPVGLLHRQPRRLTYRAQLYTPTQSRMQEIVLGLVEPVQPGDQPIEAFDPVTLVLSERYAEHPSALAVVDKPPSSPSA